MTTTLNVQVLQSTDEGWALDGCDFKRTKAANAALDLEISRAGLDDEKAEERRHEVKVGDLSFGPVYIAKVPEDKVAALAGLGLVGPAGRITQSVADWWADHGYPNMVVSKEKPAEPKPKAG